MVKLDKLGRRIPTFDRSAATKKGAATAKRKYGSDYHSKIASIADHSRNRGYLGKLKDKGRIEELRKLSKKASETRRNHFSRLKEDGKIKELKAIGTKGGKAPHPKRVSSRRNKSVSGA